MVCRSLLCEHRSAESADTDYLFSQSRQPLFATNGISPGNQPQPGGRHWGTLRAAASGQSNRDSDRQELAETCRSICALSYIVCQIKSKLLQLTVGSNDMVDFWTLFDLAPNGFAISESSSWLARMRRLRVSQVPEMRLTSSAHAVPRNPASLTRSRPNPNDFLYPITTLTRL